MYGVSPQQTCAVLLCLAISQQGRRSLLQFPPAVWAPLIVKHVTSTLFKINGRSISRLAAAIFFAVVLCCLALPWPPLTPCSVWPFPLFLHFLVCQSSLRLVCCPPVPDPLQYLHFLFLYLLFPSAPSAVTALHVVARPFFSFFLLLEKLHLRCISSRWPT